MKKIWQVLGASALALVAACAAHEKKVEAPPRAIIAESTSDDATGRLEEGIATVSATVQKVDLKNRVVTLKGPEGNVFDLQVGEEVKNLPQVRKGDEVVATYYESIGITVKKPGEAEPGISTSEDLRTAKPGEKPAAVGARQVTIVATVVGLNKKKSTATIKGPRGKTVTVTVKDRKKLDNVAVGDMVEVVYTEALAITVEKPEKAKR
jgi:hypothetical protein